jgi:hypothetical protein
MEAVPQRLLDQTAAAYANGATLDQAKKQVSDYLVSKYAANFDPKFPQRVGSNVIKAYQVIAFAPCVRSHAKGHYTVNHRSG